MADPFIVIVPSKHPNLIFNLFSRLIAASQLDTRPALSAGRQALVVLDNGRGATYVLATCETDNEAEVKASRLRAELEATNFDEWSHAHGVPAGFLDRSRDPGEMRKLIAGFRPLRHTD